MNAFHLLARAMRPSHLATMRYVLRWRRFLVALVAASALAGGLACGDSPTGIAGMRGEGKLRVHAAVGPTIQTMVVEVTAPDLPQPLAFNLTIADGAATGTIALPAGANRTITVRAFDQRTETHRGSRTVTIVEGTNAPLTITLLPLAGDQAITVQFGTTLVVVTPATASGAIGDTLRLGATITDVDGNVVNGRVRWATLDPRRALVDTLGLVTFRDTGTVQVIATYGTVGGSASLRGLLATTTPSAILRQWVGGATAAPRDWQTANNWNPATVPTRTDSVVIAATANAPQLRAPVEVRDLVVESGASVNSVGQPLVVTGTFASAGVVNGVVSVRSGARVSGTLPSLDVRGTVAVAGAATIDGTVSVLGAGSDLRLGGQHLVVRGTLSVAQGATLTMDAAADTLEALGDVAVSSDAGDHAGRLTAGTVLMRGANFGGSRWLASGTNRLVMAGNAPQLLSGFDFIGRGDNALRDLEVRSATTLCGHVRVGGTLQVNAGAALTQGCGGYYLRVDGDVTTASGSTVGVYLVDLRAPTGTAGVEGSWSPTNTEFNGVAQAIKGGLAYQNVRLTRAQQLSSSLVLAGGLAIDGPAGALDINGHRLRVQGDLRVAGGGWITMDAAADTVDVRGTLDVNGAADLTGRLTAGVILAGGNVQGGAYAGSGTHRLVLDGTGAQQQLASFDFISRPGNVLQDLVVANTSGVMLCGHVRVRGTLDVQAPVTWAQGCGGYYTRVDGELRTVPGSVISSYLFTLANASGTSNVLGTWRPTYTEFTLPAQPVRPGLDYQNVNAFQSITFSGNTSIAGELYADGAAATIALGGHRVDAGRFRVQNGATLTMNAAADTLWVAGDVQFTGGAQAGRLTAGVIASGGTVNGSSLVTAGTHKLLLNGQGGRQQLSGFDFARSVHEIEIANMAGVTLCGHVVVDADMRISTPVALYGDCGGYTLQVRGALRTVPGSSVQAYRVQLDDARGTQFVAGAFTPVVFAVNAPGMTLRPDLAYQNLEVFQALTLADSLTFNGSITLSGNPASLTLGGHRLRVRGTFNLDANATVTMTSPADSLVVDGDIFLDGGTDLGGRLTAGTIVWRGAGSSWSNYRGTGTSRVVIDGSGSVTQSVGGSPTFRDLVVSGTAPVFFACGATIAGSFTVASTATVGGCGQLTLAGPLATVAGSVFRPDNVELRDASGTEGVAGTWGAGSVRFVAVDAVVRPSLAYGNAYFSSSTTLAGPTAFGGILQVDGNGAVLSLGGNRVTVGSYVNTDNTAVVAMTDARDTLDVRGDVFIDGGDESTYLTAGTFIMAGNSFAGSQYRASGTHRTVLAGASGAPIGVSGAPVMRVLELAGTRGASFGCGGVVLDTLRVSAPAPLSGCGTLRVGGPLVAVAGSTLTLDRLQLDHASGTSLVAGTFAPATTAFTSPFPAINPSLAYRAVELAQGGALSGNTTLTGSLSVGGAGRTLTLAGHRLTVGGLFTIGGGAVLTMTDARDTLDVRGPYAQFASNVGDETGQLTAGVLRVSGDLYLDGDNFDTGGSFRTVFDGTGSGVQSVNNATAARPLQEVVVAGTRDVNIPNLVTRGTFTVSTASPITIGGFGTQVFQGAVSVPATTTWSQNVSWFDAPSGTSGILGPYAAARTVFNGSAQTIATGANFTYRAVEVRGGDVRLAGQALFNGDLDVYGTLTVQSAGVADATGRVTLVNGATLVNNLGGVVRYGTGYTQQPGATLVGAAPVPR